MRRRRNFTRLIGRVVGHSGLLAWSLLGVGPFILILVLSLRTNMAIFIHPLSAAGPYEFSNYSQAWHGLLNRGGWSITFATRYWPQWLRWLWP